MSQILSRAERDALAELVAKVERHTAGELVTVVLKRSASYAAYRIGWAVGLALLLVASLHLVWPSLPAMEVLGAEALFIAAIYGVLGCAPLLRLLVPRHVRQRSANELAKRLFLELGVTETRDRSGVLILLSELEHRVEILGDRGIHEHLGADAWGALVASLVSSIRSGRAAEGLHAVIENLGRELAAKFPPRADDTNELPNRVITDDD
jgi:putative membrane protein